MVLTLGQTSGVSTAVTAKRLENGDLIIAAHSTEVRNPLHIYRSRWSIETLFRFLKTSQFNIESTGITDPFKLRNLMHIRPLAEPRILDSGQEKIREEPECTQAYMRIPSLFLTNPEIKRQRLCKRSILILCFLFITPSGPISFFKISHSYYH